MAITIATINDVPELNTLVNKAYRGEESQKGWTTEAGIVDGTRSDEKMLIDHINTKNGVIYKYVDDLTDEITAAVYYEVKESKLYFGMLSVSPQAQGKGIGKSLLDHAVAYGQQHHCKLLTGTIIETRSELKDWYFRYGFRTNGNKLPFPDDPRCGIPKVPVELLEIEKDITIK
jgi:ribosomal protein S18 acetylase RimI-like enzyme